MKTYNSFQDAYRQILEDIVGSGEEISVNGKLVKEITPYEFRITNPCNRMLNLESRKNMYRYIFGELLWYLSASDDMTFIRRYAKYWETISDDGVHSNSAYGKYIFGDMMIKGEGVRYNSANHLDSQWEFCKGLLKKDRNTRQAVINIKPIQMYDTKDTVCTFYMHFMIRNDKLDLHVGMRSNDAVRGTPYDVFMFTFMQEMMACELDLDVGNYYHHANNIHIYESDYGLVEKIREELKLNKKPYEMHRLVPGFRSNEIYSLLAIERELGKLSAASRELLLLELRGETFYE